MVPHTRTILTPPSPHHHHTVLLHIMSFPGNVAADDPATGQTHFRGLALSGVGFLGLRDADFEAHAFHLGPVAHRGGDGPTGFFGFAGVVADLVEGGTVGGGGGEEAD
jgi:hypothetical protein